MPSFHASWSSFTQILARISAHLPTWTSVYGTHLRVKHSLMVSFRAVCPSQFSHFEGLVLSNKNNQAQSKGKDADLAKWDAEVRQSLAKKKSAAAPTLSKQEQSLVQAQIEKEAKIRSRINSIKANLERSLQIISCLACGNIEDFQAHVSQVATLILSSGALDKGALLVGSLTFNTYLVIVVNIPNSRINSRSGSVKMLFQSA